MRIKTQFVVSIAVFTIVLLIVTTSVIISNQQISQIDQRQAISANVEQGADELNTISSQYFLYQQTQLLTFWHSNITSISNNLSSLNFADSEQALVNKARDDLDQLNTSFTNLVSFLETAPRNVSVRVIPEFQHDWNQTVSEHQIFGLDASQLSESLRAQAEQLRLTNIGLVVALLVVFGALLLTMYVIAYRRTLRSISNLQEGIKIIGSGNLDYLIPTKMEDEIGELSQAFNTMTANLKTTTASKKDLEQEIAERKQAEEALRENELRLRFHAENIPLSVVEWDNNFVVTRWAGDAEKMFGWTASETVGKPIMDLHMIYEQDIPVVERTITRLTSGETRVVSSNRNITKDGRVIYCSWYNSVLLDEKGKMVSVFSFVEDNTARVNAEKILQETNLNLERLVEERTKQLQDSERLAAIGATAGMVGHDIRNPLQAITSDVYLAKTELGSVPESEEKKNALDSLREIENNVGYINKIVADLQDFARPLNPHTEEVNIKLIIEKLLEKNDLPENVKVSVKVESEAMKIVADSTYLNRIMYNLVNNAVQAMPKGGKLAIHVYKKETNVLITVKDTGVGIPEGVKNKLFTPMFTTKSKGQGFGLAVVKRMTEALGGAVTFESQEGKGTTFIVRFPSK